MSHPVRSSGLGEAEMRERIAHKLQFHTNIAHIARTLDLEYHQVLDVVRTLDAAEWNRIIESTDEERGWHVRMLKRIVEHQMDSIEQGRPLYEKNFELVRDDAGAPVMIASKTKESRTVLAALERHSKLIGLDAPTKSLNVNVNARTVISPEQQQALITDPEYRRHVLAMEQRERELLSQGEGHVAGPVRGGGEPGEMVLRPAPGAPEPEDDGGRDRRDHPPGHLHAAPARQEPLSLDVLPGVVPGHLPRSEGDPGQL
jgi:hypothetical protein